MSPTVKTLITALLVATLMGLGIAFSTHLAPRLPPPPTDPFLLAYREALTQCRTRATALGFDSEPHLARVAERFVDGCVHEKTTRAGSGR